MRVVLYFVYMLIPDQCFVYCMQSARSYAEQCTVACRRYFLQPEGGNRRHRRRQKMPEPFASAEISTGERLSAEEEFDAISGRWVAAKDVLATGRLLKVLLPLLLGV